MNHRTFVPTPSDYEQEFVFEIRGPRMARRAAARPRPARRPPRRRPPRRPRFPVRGRGGLPWWAGTTFNLTIDEPAAEPEPEPDASTPDAAEPEPEPGVGEPEPDATEPDASEWEVPAPGPATVSRPCPQKAGTAKDRCSSPRPCPAIPDLRCVTRVSGIPFHYVAGVGRDAATKLRRVTKRQEARTQRMVPRAIACLEAFVRNARRFGLPFDTILTMGSLYCRCIRGSNPPALSNHSFGDAIDVAGVRWAAAGGPASRVRETIVHNFRDLGQRALLRRLNACLRLSFATVIDYHRADHQDHFHCDTNQGRGRITRGSANLRFVQEALGAVLGRVVKITGKLDEATKKALLDYSKKGPEIFKSDRSLNQVFDQLFRQVAAGKGS